MADHSADVERILTRTSSYRFSAERLEEEREMEIQRTKSVPIAPTKTSDGNILVTWYTTDDPENPQNWSRGKKYFVLFQLAYVIIRLLVTLPGEGELTFSLEFIRVPSMLRRACMLLVQSTSTTIDSRGCSTDKPAEASWMNLVSAMLQLL